MHANKKLADETVQRSTHHIIQLDAILEAQVLKLFISILVPHLGKEQISAYSNCWHGCCCCAVQASANVLMIVRSC